MHWRYLRSMLADVQRGPHRWLEVKVQVQCRCSAGADGGADGAGTPAATAEYGWLVGGTDEDSLEALAEGAT